MMIQVYGRLKELFQQGSSWYRCRHTAHANTMRAGSPAMIHAHNTRFASEWNLTPSNGIKHSEWSLRVEHRHRHSVVKEQTLDEHPEDVCDERILVEAGEQFAKPWLKERWVRIQLRSLWTPHTSERTFTPKLWMGKLIGPGQSTIEHLLSILYVLHRLMCVACVAIYAPQIIVMHHKSS